MDESYEPVNESYQDSLSYWDKIHFCLFCSQFEMMKIGKGGLICGELRRERAKHYKAQLDKGSCNKSNFRR